MGLLAASRLPDWFNDLNSIIGVFGTLIGFGITFWQLLKTKRAAEAARNAALATALAAKAEYAKFVVSTCHRFLGEARIHVENCTFSLAAIRSGDLAGQLALVKQASPELLTNIDEIVNELRAWESMFMAASNTNKDLSSNRRAKWMEFVRRLQATIDGVHGPFAAGLGGNA